MKVFKSHIGAISAIIVGVICASGTGVVVKSTFSYGVSAISVITLRMIFALPLFLLLGVFHFARNKTIWKRLSVRDYLKVTCVGIIGYYLTSYVNFVGLQYVSASLERVVLFVYPTIVVVLSAVFYRQQISIGQIVSIVVTYIGLIISFADKITLGDDSDLLLGVAWILLSAILFAFYLLLSKDLVVVAGVIPVTVISLFVATLAVYLHFWLQENSSLWEFSVDVYYNIGIMAIFTTFVPAVLLGYGLKWLSATTVAIVSSIGPPAGFVLAYLFLGEEISYMQILGSFVVIGGVLFLQIARRN